MGSGWKNQRGMSLVEGILAILILSIGITGFLGNFYEYTRNAVDSEFIVTASNLANEQLEIVLNDKNNVGYAQINNAKYPSPSNITVGNITFAKSVNVYEVSSSDLTSSSPGSGLKRIDVSVSWGTGQTIIYNAIVGQY